MKKKVTFRISTVLLCVIFFALTIKPVYAFDRGDTVTIKGVVLMWAAVHPSFTGPTSDNGGKRPLIFAMSGTKAIEDKVENLLNIWYPNPDERSMTADEASGLLADWQKQLMFWLEAAPDTVLGALATQEWGNNPFAVTGWFEERDSGTFFIVISSEGLGLLGHSHVPERLRATRDIPHVPNDGYPDFKLRLNKAGTMVATMKYIPAAGQTFLAGSPFYLGTRYQDEFPYKSGFSKSYYMMEIPVTQAMWQEVMGQAPPQANKDRQNRQMWASDRPVEFAPLSFDPYIYRPNLHTPNPALDEGSNTINEFIRKVADLNGLVFNRVPPSNERPTEILELRIPTDAEWEFAARTGASNPAYTTKYASQGMTTTQGSFVVAQRNPSAWGLYDMLSGGWHRVTTRKANNIRYAVTDYAGPAVTNVQSNGFKAKGGYHYTVNAPHMHGCIDDGVIGNLQEGGTLIFRLIVWDADELIRMDTK